MSEKLRFFYPVLALRNLEDATKTEKRPHSNDGGGSDGGSFDLDSEDEALKAQIQGFQGAAEKANGAGGNSGRGGGGGANREQQEEPLDYGVAYDWESFVVVECKRPP